MNNDNNQQTPEGFVQPSPQAQAGRVSVSEAQPVSLGPYAVHGLLGEGAMGKVYLATHAKLKQRVALKVLPSFHGQDVARIAKFTREMGAVGQLHHPNIVRTITAGEDQGMHYIAMEFVEGLDVQRIASKGPLDEAAACEIIRQAAAGLQTIQDHGLVHRDIKPSNLMINQAGVIKILDLGIGGLRYDDLGPLTVDSQLMGTPDYVAPEQFTDSGRVDIRADIYSLGCTLYRLLSGHVPFDGPNFDTHMAKVMGHIQREPRPISDLVELRPALVNVVQKMMEKNPDRRFQTPTEVVAAMCNWGNGEHLPQFKSMESSPKPTAAQRYRTSTPALKAEKTATATLVDTRRFPAWKLIAGGLLLTVSTCIGGYVLANRPSTTAIPADQLQVVRFESSEKEASESPSPAADTMTEASGEAELNIIPIESSPTDEQAHGEATVSIPTSEPESEAIQSIAESTEQPATKLETLSNSDMTSEEDAQLIVNPADDIEIYHNARTYSQQGRHTLARESYLRLLNNGTEFVDVHKDFQNLLVLQEGIARAREIYMSNFNRENVTPTTELALVLLQEPEVKLRGLVSLRQRHPNFAPAAYELGNQISQLSEGSYSSALNAQEIEVLEAVKQLHSRGELLGHYLDQTQAEEIVRSVQQRLTTLAMVEEAENTKQSLAKIKFSWLTFGERDDRGKLFFTNLAAYRSFISQVKYGLNTNKPENTYQFPTSPSDGQDGLAVSVDDSVRFVVVRLTFTDGTKSQLVRIDRN